MRTNKRNHKVRNGFSENSWTKHLIVLVVSLAMHQTMDSAQAETELFMSPQGSDTRSGHVAVPVKQGVDDTVKVFILAGQSNMQGHGKVNAEQKANEGKGSLEWLVKNDEHGTTVQAFGRRYRTVDCP